MSRPTIPFSQLDTSELLTIHNTLAQQCGEPTCKTWTDSRCRLVERVAILRTLPFQKAQATPTATKVKRPRPIEELVVKTLAVVDYYEDAKTGERLEPLAAARRRREGHSIISVGLHYSEVLKRVLAEFPDARTSTASLRVMASAVRNGKPGLEHISLPHKRPHTLGKATS